MAASLETRERTLEELHQRHRVSGCGQNHQTFFGRWALTYEAALRDVLVGGGVQQQRDELRVLMLGSSVGMVALDFLSLFHKVVAEIGLQTRCKIVALDICEGVVGIAQNGFHELCQGVDRRVEEIHGGVPWIFLDEKRLMVKWDALAASGHVLDYRVFDMDKGLSALGEAPFDLVEISNCHNADNRRKVANVQSVTHDRSLALSSTYTDRQEILFYQQFGEILREVNDPEVLRFMSGLVRVNGASGDFCKQAKMDCFSALLKLAQA